MKQTKIRKGSVQISSKTTLGWVTVFGFLIFHGFGGIIFSAGASAAAEGMTNPIVRYAQPGGAGDCSSWEKACDLQIALREPGPVDEIWAAQGVYHPDIGPERSFQLRNNLALYGGFAGHETTRDQRDPARHETVLSGDLLGDDGPGFTNISDNSIHVVDGSETDASAVLDGFTISGGNAWKTEFLLYSGGGMFNNHGSPTLSRIIFTRNRAAIGGGLFNYLGSSPTLTDVTFVDNMAGIGGGMANYINSSPVVNNAVFSGNTADLGAGLLNYAGSNASLTNVTFSGNAASMHGGGMANSEASATLTNVTFYGNSAGTAGGGLAVNNFGHALLTNCIFWDNTSGSETMNIYGFYATINYSIVQGGWPGSGSGNINRDPLLLPLADNGGYTRTHALRPGSPAIDAGSPDDSICPPYDQRGTARPIDGSLDGQAICDMGAYEFQPLTVYLPLIGR
jgi:hypothetical protein